MRATNSIGTPPKVTSIRLAPSRRRTDLYRHLGTIAKAIPTPRFHQVMLTELSEFIDWRGRAVSRYSANSIPELLFDEGIDHSNYQLYLDGFYRLDPYYALCQSGPISSVYTLKRDFPESAGNAYMTAYLPLAGWRDDVGMFFPGFGTASIGLFWEKTKPVKKSELNLLEQLYPLLRDMHETHILVVLGQLATQPLCQDLVSIPFVIMDREEDIVYRSDTWLEQSDHLRQDCALLVRRKGGKHRYTDGSQLLVERLPKSFSNAPEGWIGLLEVSSKTHPPITMELALSKFSSARVTKRESQILGLILSGHSNASISQHLRISVGAVKNHRVRLYRKFDVTAERALVHLFVQHLTSVDNN